MLLVKKSREAKSKAKEIQFGSGTEFISGVELFSPEMGWVGMEW